MNRRTTIYSNNFLLAHHILFEGDGHGDKNGMVGYRKEREYANDED
jgi:hypothetical protein